MKRYLRLLSLLAVLLSASHASGQGALVAGDLDTFIALVKVDCPIEYTDAWAVNSIDTNGDTVQVVLQTPASLAGFLPMLTGDDERVRKLWFKQLKSFGRPWDDLFDRVADVGRTLLITFAPKDSRVRAEILYSPEDITVAAGAGQPIAE